MMKRLLSTCSSLCLALPATAASFASLDPIPAHELRAAELAAPDLLDLRAGRAIESAPLAADERDALFDAQDDASPLLDMRGGFDDLSNHDWTLIAVGGLVVLLLIIIF